MYLGLENDNEFVSKDNEGVPFDWNGFEKNLKSDKNNETNYETFLEKNIEKLVSKIA